MKHKGCEMHFSSQRNSELLRTYKKIISMCECIDVQVVAVAVVNSPCSRFWVSEERALYVVSNMLKGNSVLDGMNPTKRDMYIEIFNRVCLLRTLRPDDYLSDIVFDVVNSPAPCFFLQPRTALEYIHSTIRRNKKKR